MTGNELIQLIQNGKLYERHFFLNVEGYVSPIQEIMENEKGDIILSQEGRAVNDWKDTVGCDNLKNYFSEWFTIIPEEEARNLWKQGDKNFLVLRADGSRKRADTFESSWEEIAEDDRNKYYGLEREKA